MTISDQPRDLSTDRLPWQADRLGDGAPADSQAQLVGQGLFGRIARPQLRIALEMAGSGGDHGQIDDEAIEVGAEHIAREPAEPQKALAHDDAFQAQVGRRFRPGPHHRRFPPPRVGAA